MTLLTKDALLATSPRKTRELEMPELGGTLRLRELPPSAVPLLAEKEGWDATLYTVRVSIVGEDNRPLFTEEDFGAWMEQLNLPTLNALVEAVLDLNAAVLASAKAGDSGN